MPLKHRVWHLPDKKLLERQRIDHGLSSSYLVGICILVPFSHRRWVTLRGAEVVSKRQVDHVHAWRLNLRAECSQPHAQLIAYKQVHQGRHSSRRTDVDTCH